MDTQLQDLFSKYLRDALTKEERVAFLNLVRDPEQEEALKKLIQSEVVSETPVDREMSSEAGEAMFRRILTPSALVLPMPTRRSWKPWAVAAAALLVGVGLYYRFREVSFVLPVAQQIASDIKAPGKARAVLMLAGGQKIFLDSVGNGTLAVQQQVKVEKLSDGKLMYTGTGNSTELAMNTLSNPRGSRVITVTLSDGTQVWLNAESSITYPAVFTGGERRVLMKGEAYFQVKHDAVRPFRVEAPGALVEDLGTGFDVRAYQGEETEKVTLVEGAVRVRVGAGALALRPGDQAVCNKSVGRNSAVDIDQVLAWKNDLFDFRRASLRSIMMEISRWYDVQVSYAPGVPDEHYSGIVERSENVSEVLKVMERAGAKFRIAGNTITVLQ